MKRKEQTEEVTVERIARQCIAVRVRLLNRVVTKLYNDALRSYGLTVSQMNILVAVSHLGEAKQGDICRALHLDKSTLSRDVERMKTQGWLEKLSGQDRRIGLLRITRQGEKLLKQTFPAWNQAQQQGRTLLREEDVAGLNSAIRALGLGRSI
jgi:DNA-binding MarR family transcriptional regulator